MDTWHEALNELQQIIDDLRAEPRWIPCTERMPRETYVMKFSDTVLVTAEFVHDETHKRFVTTASTIRGKWYGEWNDPDKKYKFSVKVHAWMPLPEPYKGEQA